MTIIEKDIERYTGYMEFAYDGLVQCHPNDEAKFRGLILAYQDVIAVLEKLEQLSLGK